MVEMFNETIALGVKVSGLVMINAKSLSESIPQMWNKLTAMIGNNMEQHTETQNPSFCELSQSVGQ